MANPISVCDLMVHFLSGSNTIAPSALAIEKRSNCSVKFEEYKYDFNSPANDQPLFGKYL